MRDILLFIAAFIFGFGAMSMARATAIETYPDRARKQSAWIGIIYMFLCIFIASHI